MTAIQSQWEKLERHSRWLEYWTGSVEDRKKGAAPAPGYRDCQNCPLRAQAVGEDDRRATCAACPWAHIPPAPSSRFLFALEMLRYPRYVLAATIAELSPSQHQDLSELQSIQDSRKEEGRLMAMVGIMFGGAASG